MSFGVRLEDWRRYGVLDTTTQLQSPASSLRNAVHPVWSRRRFNMIDMETDCDYWVNDDPQWLHPTPMPDDVWSRLRPALQLATNMMRMSEVFFLKVSFADIDESASNPDRLIFDETYAPTETREYRDRLRYLSTHHRIYFGDTVGRRASWAHTEGRNWRGEHYIFTVLSDQFLLRLSDPAFDGKPADVKQRVWWKLAATLVHEIAHSIYSVRRGLTETITNHNINDEEPLMSEDDCQSELGQAWSDWWCGGDIIAVDEVHGSHGVRGLILVPWIAHVRHEVCTSINALSLSTFFDHERWVRQLDSSLSNCQESGGDEGTSPFAIEITPAWSDFTVSEHPPCDCYDAYFDQKLRDEDEIVVEQKVPLTPFY